MGSTSVKLAVLLLGSATLAGSGEGPQVNDDLAVVKRAVHAPVPAPALAIRPSSGEARWLKVRILEEHGRTKINVRLPLAAVRALGGDLPIRVKGAHLRLSEILRTLETGEPLVEVKDEDSDIRVWVE
jgi:hypothetical protein